MHHNLDDGGVQLVLVAHGGGTPLEVAHIAVVVGHDERALELAGVGRIDAEVGRQLHGTAHPLGDVDKRTVAKDGRVEGGKEVVAIRHDRPQVAFHQIGVVFHRLAERAEDNPQLGQFLAEGGAHRHTVHHGIDGHTRELHLLFERDAQFVEGLAQLGVHLLEALGSRLGLGRSVVANGLIVDFGNRQVGPVGHLEGFPVGIRLEAEVEQPLGFALLLRDVANNLLAQTFGDNIGLDVGHETVFILIRGNVAQYFIRIILFHFQSALQFSQR